MENFSANFIRANTVESSHKYKILVKNLNGKTIISSKNENDFVYPRSSIKIFQAIPFMESNPVKHFKLNSKQLALACSSHRGEYFHIKELESWKKKIGIVNSDLQCGIHYPLNSKSSERLFRLNKYANQIHNNCSGKHLAMLTTCIISNYIKNKYLDFYHPHQLRIRKVFEKFSNKQIVKKNFGIDGCSAPQYSFKIKDIVKMVSNLNKSYNDNFHFSNEVKLLVNSIICNPRFIGGSDSLDSRIMEITKKNIFCKGGAEGVFLFTELKKGLSGIVKVIDGNDRAIPYIVYSLFKKLKIMNENQLRALKKIYSFKLNNHANINIGAIETKI